MDRFDGNNIEKLEGITIQFKKHYNESKCLNESDVKKLIENINDLKKISKDIYVCGTSIFRSLNDIEKEKFPERFKRETGYNFNIITQESENELTVFGTTRFVKNKADILILAGGGHEKFARYSGIKYEENILYKDNASPIMMDIETRKRETERYYKSISLNEIRKRVKDPEWWYATRAMSAFVLVVAEAIGAKYIVPTDIAMVYGILNRDNLWLA